MKVTATIARIVLGLLFTVAGLSGLFLINNPPPAPGGLAGQFQDVFFASRWVLFVDGVELAAGALLLANRYVPVALLLLAGVLPNILVFHVTMQLSGIAPGMIATALWTIVALRYRSLFAPLFVAKARADEPAPSRAGTQLRVTRTSPTATS